MVVMTMEDKERGSYKLLTDEPQKLARVSHQTNPQP
jgi:hypothetical protein